MVKGYFVYDRNFKTLYIPPSGKTCFATEYAAKHSWERGCRTYKAYIGGKAVMLRFHEQTRYIVVSLPELLKTCHESGVNIGGCYG